MRMSFVTTVTFALTIAMGVGAGADPANFDDLSLATESYWNGSDLSGGFTSGSAFFANSYDAAWSYWEGFAYSNLSQEEEPLSGLAGQYTAIAGAGESGSNYGIGYVGWAGLPTMSLAEPMQLDGAYFTNTNYNYYSMLNGDGFAKKFGGATGNDEDWFLLTIEGVNIANDSTGTVEFYLADYRFADSGADYIVDEWTLVDLSGLGQVKELTFGLSSSDNDPIFGMNTPAYFAMDTMIPEPSVCLLLCLGAVALLGRRG